MKRLNLIHVHVFPGKPFHQMQPFTRPSARFHQGCGMEEGHGWDGGMPLEPGWRRELLLFAFQDCSSSSFLGYILGWFGGGVPFPGVSEHGEGRESWNGLGQKEP